MTPIFYHPAQDVQYDFVSIRKIPEFVRQSKRELRSGIIPYANEDFYVAHSPHYVDGVFDGSIKNGFGNHNVYINEALRYTNASVETAAHCAMLSDGVACSATQGFHHAGYDGGHGYCTFNGLVIAAIKLLPQVERVLILDGDGHHGDGTDDCIQRTSRQAQVFNASRQLFGRGAQRIWEPLMWKTFTMDLIRESKPGIIFYQAGADAWEKDPYRAGYLTTEGMAHRDRGIFEACKEAQVPIVWNLAGGYSEPMQLVVDLHLQTLRISDEVFYGEAEER